MILAGDVGGTKTSLGLYKSGAVKPNATCVSHFQTLNFDGLSDIVKEFLLLKNNHTIEAACFGVSGPVIGQTAQLTNVPWSVDANVIAKRFSIPSVIILNDLATLGHAVEVLSPDQLAVLQTGEPVKNGNAALIAPGTGLGEAILHYIDNRWVPCPSEGGNADFAPRTPREIKLLEVLTARFGRVSYEHVISGPGLINIYQFVHNERKCPAVSNDVLPSEQPALISKAGLNRECLQCEEVLDLFVTVLGAESGNLGLRSVATAGIYLGGGIPRQILTALKSRSFLDAFKTKFPMQELVEKMPISVILERDATLLGAAVAAKALTNQQR